MSMPSHELADVDTELRALSEIGRALDGLDQAAIERALEWAAARYGVATSRSGRATVRDADIPRLSQDQPFDLPEAFQRATPATQSQKVLLATYWFQSDKRADVEAQVINSALKQMGHRIANITAVYADLIRARPQLVMQTAKSGNARQARKRYRVTTEGVRMVEAMLSGRSAESESDDE